MAVVFYYTEYKLKDMVDTIDSHQLEIEELKLQNVDLTRELDTVKKQLKLVTDILKANGLYPEPSNPPSAEEEPAAKKLRTSQV